MYTRQSIVCGSIKRDTSAIPQTEIRRNVRPLPADPNTPARETTNNTGIAASTDRIDTIIEITRTTGFFLLITN